MNRDVARSALPALLSMRGLLLGWICLTYTYTAGRSQQPDPPFQFVDRSPEAGLTVEMLHGGPQKQWIAEANGSGLAALDYDQDGWLDLVIVGGSTIEHLRKIKSDGEARSGEARLWLFRNTGDGDFVDVTIESGLVCPYWGTGANAADYDGDGDPDILITTVGRDLLFENQGSGRFKEVSAQAGLSRRMAWHTGSAFGDYDQDGDPDLYIAGYVSLGALPLDSEPLVCSYRGLDSFCGPMGLAGEPDLLYRNNGDGSFTDVSQTAGIRLPVPRHGFSVLFEDLDNDGWIDLFVSNDSDPNLLYMNRGNGTFKDAALARGVAYNASGNAQADMGVAVGDFDSDGDLDLLTTTFSEDYFPLFEQHSKGVFADVSHQLGLGRSTLPLLGWGCGFADLDNDADQDLWVLNGHVYPKIAERGGSSYHQPIALFENRGGKFERVEEAIPGLPANSYRGGLQGDFNNDGRVDLVALPIRGRPVFLANTAVNQNSWIGFRLESDHPNRDALGTRVEVEFCGQRRFNTVRNGGGYLSRNDPRLHFGLGKCSQVDSVRVRWPGGRSQTLSGLEINRWLTLRNN